MSEYTESLLQYEKRISKVTKDVIMLETIKANMLKLFKPVSKKLNEEREKILNLIKSTQAEYLEKGNIETRLYQNRMRSYAERLTEVEEHIADQEARNAIRQLRHPYLKAKSEIFSSFADSFKISRQTLKRISIPVAAIALIAAFFIMRDQTPALSQLSPPSYKQLLWVMSLISITCGISIAILIRKNRELVSEIRELQKKR